jgi:hypothetical protein
MASAKFTRPTIIAAVEFLSTVSTQAQINMHIVRLDLNREIAADDSKSVSKKAAMIAGFATSNADRMIETEEGLMTLAEATVRAAVSACIEGYENPERARLQRALARDGYVITWDTDSRQSWLRAALPGEIALPQTDDEVHQLLKQLNFSVPLGHLDQAIDAHTRGDWAAANSQIRSFLEGLLNDIALRVDPQKAAPLPAEGRRRLLADNRFLSESRNEWTGDGKNYINGLFKMLHTDGSHPGLSDEDHSTFRLHLALITGRTLLRRFANNK